MDNKMGTDESALAGERCTDTSSLMNNHVTSCKVENPTPARCEDVAEHVWRCGGAP